MIPISVDPNGDVSRYSTAVRLVVAVILVAGFLYQRFQFALPVAAVVYALLEGYRVYTLGDQRGIEVPTMINRSGALLRRIGIWAAIVLTVGYELLIGDFPLGGLLTGIFLYIGGLFAQVVRNQAN